jgi:carbon starvation protein CstA
MQTIKITVVSNQWLWILLAIVILIIIIMTIFIAGTRVARHTIEEYREERRKFVKRKSSSLNLSTIENPRRFVKRKKE